MAILEVISGAALGSSVQVLFDGLVSLGLNCMQMEGIDAHLDNLKTKLQVIYWHLDDADNRQIYGEQDVKSWLEDVRDLAYDLEDLLDKFAREADKQEQRAESSTSGGLRKTKWLSFPSDLLSNVNMRSKMQDIDCKVENILTRKDHLCLTKTAGDGSTSNQDAKRLPSTSLKEPCFVGREKEANEIIQLLKTDVSHHIPTVISIVGIGGMGKTALAQQVYNDPQVTGHFEVKAWTCVSDVFNVPGITRAILQLVTSMNCEGEDLNWLQVKLEKNLSGKKFLIVLDDVWNEKPTEWTALLKPFESGAEGSKVLLTTRSLKVASIPKASVHRLQKLHDDDCTVLFASHALGVKKFNDHPRLEVIGKKIVGKCGGLPLAAKTLGGLLRTTIETSEWEAILNSKLWDLPEERSEILPALKLSYVHLPFVLKRCFVYCAIFPTDYEIERDKLIHWWMAEGLLGENDIENKWRTGLSYFNELVSRSFFQEGEESRYLMHDLIHDLAKSITGATCFNGRELELETYERNASLARARHASFVCTSFVTSEKLKIYHEMKKLRSFVMLKMLPMYTYLPQKALHDLVSELTDVRVFSMTHSSITEIPDSISQLKHLRHLDFSYTCIHTLPKSIGSISDLEALVLEGCQQLLELPLEIEKLTKLQYLDIRDTPKLRAMPSNLPNLIMVPRFVVGKEKGSRLKMLRHMHLEGKLFISELQLVEEVEDASNAKLYEKQGIDELVLQWAQDFNGS